MDLTQTMQLTKVERKRNVWLTIFIGLIIVIISQAVAIIPSALLKNVGAKEVYELFSNIFVIVILLLFIHIFEKRSLRSMGLMKKIIMINLMKGGALGLL